MQHISVMPAETMEALQLRSGYSVVDATAGMGGHSLLLSAAVGSQGHVYACDTDPESLAMAKANCAGCIIARRTPLAPAMTGAIHMVA